MHCGPAPEKRPSRTVGFRAGTTFESPTYQEVAARKKTKSRADFIWVFPASCLAIPNTATGQSTVIEPSITPSGEDTPT